MNSNGHEQYAEQAEPITLELGAGMRLRTMPGENKNSSASNESFRDLTRICVWALVGALIVMTAWLVPAYWKSVAPSVVQSAGRGTPSLCGLGLAEVDAEKPGPASLILTAVQSFNDPLADGLATALTDLNRRKPELARWGGHDRLLESIYQGTSSTPKPNEPVLNIFLTESSRMALRKHLEDSPSPGVRTILGTRELTQTTQFVPATRPGGQPFEATILMIGLLYEGEYLSPPVAQEVRALAERARDQGAVAKWENTCMDFLGLGVRLNWTQFVELLRVAPNLKTLTELSALAKGPAQRFDHAYCAALLTRSPDGVMRYLTRFGQQGGDFLATALASGEGSVQLLLDRQLPLAPERREPLAFMAPWILQAPELFLALKFAGFALGIGCFYVVWKKLSAVETVEELTVVSPALNLRRSLAAVLLAAILMVSSEPLLFPHAGPPAYQLRITMPMLSNLPVPNSEAKKPRSKPMNLDLSTVLSIVLFGALQIVVYAICLTKIREIENARCSPQLKLKLMENEENLFDSGLYVGIAGTATALILQVLQVIEANLLAAYSSNLFGILCVAFVKIRHVRAYRRKLIMQAQNQMDHAKQQQHQQAEAHAVV
jgi:hypothetical protein